MSTELEERIEGSKQAQGITVSMSLCTKERLEVIARRAAQCLALPGEFWELGVYMGGSASLIGKIGPEKVLRLFDSFEGVSVPQPQDAPLEQLDNGEIPMWAGEWRGDIQRALLNINRECKIHKGWIPDTFADVPDVQVAFAHVDLDLYAPTKASLEFILPRLAEGGVIIVDDFGYVRHPGIRTAVEEMLPVYPNLRGKVEVSNQVSLYLRD